MLGIDPRLISVAVLCAVFFIPLDGFVAVMAKYDAYIFWAIVVGFAILSVIGTVAVVRSGDLPANDELFNLREAQRQGGQLTPAQRNALRGQTNSAAAAG